MYNRCTTRISSKPYVVRASEDWMKGDKCPEAQRSLSAPLYTGWMVRRKMYYHSTPVESCRAYIPTVPEDRKIEDKRGDGAVDHRREGQARNVLPLYTHGEL